jgi:hypothetical protein
LVDGRSGTCPTGLQNELRPAGAASEVGAVALDRVDPLERKLQFAIADRPAKAGALAPSTSSAAGHTSGVPVVVRRIFDPKKRGFGA